MTNHNRPLIVILFIILWSQIIVWLLLKIKQYRACINLSSQNIRWLEGLDNTRYYPFIATFNIRMAQCYMALGYPSDVVGCCYLAVDNYTTDSDVRIKKRAIRLRLKVFKALADESPLEKEYWMELAKADVSCIEKNRFYKK